MGLSNLRRARSVDAPRAAATRLAESRGIQDLFRENGLSLVLLGLFLLFLFGQSVTGWLVYNADAHEHGEKAVAFLPYLLTGHFWEAVFENWESEFFQMAAYVTLTACLYQKGSAESKKLPDEGENPQDEDPRTKREDPNAPGAVRAGGWRLWLYERSLALSLFGLFLFSFLGHAVGGAKEYSQEQLAHGEHAVTVLQFLGTSQFWFESMQNWQSEFLAVFTLVVLSIWMRGKGSAQSKPVAAPHEKTGE
jgi:hypothetical protein